MNNQISFSVESNHIPSQTRLALPMSYKNRNNIIWESNPMFFLKEKRSTTELINLSNYSKTWSV